MLSAVVYNSTTGSCKKYAEMLAEALNIPAYPAKNCPAPEGREVVYIGWVLADVLTGYAAFAKKAKVIGAVRVGMAAVTPDMAEKTRAKTGIAKDIPVFCLQGRFDLKGLPLPLRAIMTVKNKEIAGRLNEKAAKGPLNEQEQATLHMAVTGCGEPASWDGINEVIARYKS